MSLLSPLLSFFLLVLWFSSSRSSVSLTSIYSTTFSPTHSTFDLAVYVIAIHVNRTQLLPPLYLKQDQLLFLSNTYTSWRSRIFHPEKETIYMHYLLVFLLNLFFILLLILLFHLTPFIIDLLNP